MVHDSLEGYAPSQQPVLAWTQLPLTAVPDNRKLHSVSIGADNTVAILTTRGEVYAQSKGAWANIARAAFRTMEIKDLNTVIGIGQDFSVYSTNNASSGTGASWQRMSAGRFYSVTQGWDGSTWATTLPVGGSWQVYLYDVSMRVWNLQIGPIKQVSALSKTAAWGAAPDGTLWQWDGKIWLQKLKGQYVKVSVGLDGSVWALSASGIISRYDGRSWLPLEGAFKDFAARSASTIVALDQSGIIKMGTVAAAGPVAILRPTPFVIEAYSGGSSVFSDYQQASVAWAQISINGQDLVGSGSSSDGFNVAVVTTAGTKLLVKGYDTNKTPDAGKQLAEDVKAILSRSSSRFSLSPPPNLYGPFSGGSSSQHYISPVTGNLVFTGQKLDGFFPATVSKGAHSLLIRYRGNGDFVVAQVGVDAGNLTGARLTATGSWQNFRANVVHTQDGVHKLAFSNLGPNQSVEVVQPVLVSTSQSWDADGSRLQSDASMLVVAVQGDVGNKIDPVLTNFFNSLGASSFANVTGHCSYVFVYDIATAAIVSEQFSSSSHVLFQSSGPDSIIKSAWSIADKTALPVVNIVNKGMLIAYDLSIASVRYKVQLKNTGLPPPFDSNIDTIYQMPDKSLLLTRGKVWLNVQLDPATSPKATLLAGPGVIGKGFLSGLTDMPFINGLHAITPSPDGNAYVFCFGSYAKMDPTISRVLGSGSLGDKNGDFATLPATFTHKVDAAFLVGQAIGLVAGNQVIVYDPIARQIAQPAIPILSDPRFIGLPLTFRESNGKDDIKPFRNHTRFKDNRLLSYDIAVESSSGLAGWDYRREHSNITYNLMTPPIKTHAFLSLIPALQATYGTNTNVLLKAYESGAWRLQAPPGNVDDIPTYKGNTVTFTIVDTAHASSWRSQSVDAQHRTVDLRPAEFYKLTIWVRTTDPLGLKVGVATGAASPKNDVGGLEMAEMDVKAEDGWQMLAWEFYNPSNSTCDSLAFTFQQSSTGELMHTLYGPCLLATATQAHPTFTQHLVAVSHASLQLSDQTKGAIAYDGSQVIFKAPDQGTDDTNTRLSFFPGPRTENGTSFLTIASTTHRTDTGLPLMLCSEGKSCSMTSQLDASCVWTCLEDPSGNMYLVHTATETMLCIAPTGQPSMVPCQGSINDLSPTSAFRMLTQQPLPPRTTPQYVSATFLCRSANMKVASIVSDGLVLFRGDIFIILDTVQWAPLVSPIHIREHSWFVNLPEKFDIGCALQTGLGTFLFSDGKYQLCDLSTNSTKAGPNWLGPCVGSQGGLFNLMPPPFSKHLDGAFNKDSSTAIFISGNTWLQWNTVDNTPIATGMMTDSNSPLQNLDAEFVIDSCVEHPTVQGQVILFSGAEYVIYDLARQRIVEGPKALGSPSTMFANLPPPFIPTAAEVCDIYLHNIRANTEYAKASCVDDPKRPYSWLSDCLFSDKSCAEAGGIWNDVGSFCGSSVSKGNVPLKSIDASVRDLNYDLYTQTCRPVSVADFNAMKKTETDKYNSAIQSTVLRKKMTSRLAAKAVVEQKNLASLNQQLAAVNLKLENESGMACHPQPICLKKIDSMAGREIPLRCDKESVLALIRKDPMTDVDIQALVHLLTKRGALNDFPITQHPNFTSLSETSSIVKCPPPKQNNITDFKLTDFPDFWKYIAKDSLVHKQVPNPTSRSQPDMVKGASSLAKKKVGRQDHRCRMQTGKAPAPKPSPESSYTNTNTSTERLPYPKMAHGKFSDIINHALAQM